MVQFAIPMTDLQGKGSSHSIGVWKSLRWGAGADPSLLNEDTLLEVAFIFFVDVGCIMSLRMSPGKFRLFLCKIRDNYRNNAYHCWAHAVHVVSNAARLLVGLASLDLFAPEERFCLLFSALIHDLDHPGHSNSMEISNKSDIARAYNDQSVLEMHSIALAYDLADQMHLFSHLSDHVCADMREKVVEIILATDIGPPSGRCRSIFVRSRWELAFADGFSINNRAQRLSILVQLMRAADVGSAIQPYTIFANWSQRLFIENRLASGLTHMNHAKTQGPFLGKYCLPLIQLLQAHPVLSIGDEMRGLLQANLTR